MLDIGWSEMAIIAVVALFVIGPKDLPKVLRTVGRYAGKVRAMAREFQDSIDEAVREAELDEVKKQIESASKMDVNKAISDTVDPGGEIGRAMDVNPTAKPKPDKPDKEDEAPAGTGAPAQADAPAAAPPSRPPTTFSQAAARAAKPANGGGEAPGAGKPTDADGAPAAQDSAGAKEARRAADKAGA